jgi:hypothetical protein
MVVIILIISSGLAEAGHILSVEFNQNVESKLEYVEFMW